MESIVLSSEGREPRAIRAFAEALESHSAFFCVSQWSVVSGQSLVLVSGQLSVVSRI